jgi:outer membrane protein TolC
MARAELKASQQKAQQTENDVALKVHQLYYKVLIALVRRAAIEASIKALQDLQRERIQQVKFGSIMEENLIESQAQLLQLNQELLITDLQLSDIKLQLNDAMGLPLATALDLDPNTMEAHPACARETKLRHSNPNLRSSKHATKWRKRMLRLGWQERTSSTQISSVRVRHNENEEPTYPTRSHADLF